MVTAATAAPFSLPPGWYWFDFADSESAAWTAFTGRYKGKLRTRRTWSAAARSVVVFQVTESIPWELGGRPTPAPKGIKTSLRDMASAPDPSPGLSAMLEQLTWESSTLFKVLFWGGAAILLINLFRQTSPVDDDEEQEAA